ncbi:hypothetical protein [Clostridium perfringens]|uniref:hypothetical protein n=1 Tax=Clostridium perfringens TaxID=1502 RepID=UPI00399CF557
MREKLEYFFRYIAVNLEKKEAIFRLKYGLNLSEEDATKEYDNWRRKWCDTSINKEF